jgi:hypothetical protein
MSNLVIALGDWPAIKVRGMDGGSQYLSVLESPEDSGLLQDAVEGFANSLGLSGTESLHTVAVVDASASADQARALVDSIGKYLRLHCPGSNFEFHYCLLMPRARALERALGWDSASFQEFAAQLEEMYQNVDGGGSPLFMRTLWLIDAAVEGGALLKPDEARDAISAIINHGLLPLVLETSAPEDDNRLAVATMGTSSLELPKEALTSRLVGVFAHRVLAGVLRPEAGPLSLPKVGAAAASLVEGSLRVVISSSPVGSEPLPQAPRLVSDKGAGPLDPVTAEGRCREFGSEYSAQSAEYVRRARTALLEEQAGQLRSRIAERVSSSLENLEAEGLVFAVALTDILRSNVSDRTNGDYHGVPAARTLASLFLPHMRTLDEASGFLSADGSGNVVDLREQQDRLRERLGAKKQQIEQLQQRVADDEAGGLEASGVGEVTAAGVLGARVSALEKARDEYAALVADLQSSEARIVSHDEDLCDPLTREKMRDACVATAVERMTQAGEQLRAADGTAKMVQQESGQKHRRFKMRAIVYPGITAVGVIAFIVCFFLVKSAVVPSGSDIGFIESLAGRTIDQTVVAPVLRVVTVVGLVVVLLMLILSAFRVGFGFVSWIKSKSRVEEAGRGYQSALLNYWNETGRGVRDLQRLDLSFAHFDLLYDLRKWLKGQSDRLAGFEQGLMSLASEAQKMSNAWPQRGKLTSPLVSSADADRQVSRLKDRVDGRAQEFFKGDRHLSSYFLSRVGLDELRDDMRTECLTSVFTDIEDKSAVEEMERQRLTVRDLASDTPAMLGLYSGKFPAKALLVWGKDSTSGYLAAGAKEIGAQFVGSADETVVAALKVYGGMRLEDVACLDSLDECQAGIVESLAQLEAMREKDADAVETVLAAPVSAAERPEELVGEELPGGAAAVLPEPRTGAEEPESAQKEEAFTSEAAGEPRTDQSPGGVLSPVDESVERDQGTDGAATAPTE